MKWLFSILIVANIGLFIWSYPQGRSADNRQPRAQAVGDLRLVDESPGETAGAEEAAPGEPPTAQPQASEPLAGKPAEAAQPSPAEETAGPEQDNQVAEAAVGEEAVPQAQNEQPPVETQAEPRLACEKIGFFEKRSQAELLSVQLRALGLKPDISSVTSNGQAGFWVLIPPQANRSQAIAKANRLEAAGVEDIWRFTSGNLAHAISLGLFRDEERAEARKKQIEDLGFNPVVRPRYREMTRFWLSYQYTGESPVTTLKWQEFKKTFPDIESKAVDCP